MGKVMKEAKPSPRTQNIVSKRPAANTGKKAAKKKKGGDPDKDTCNNSKHNSSHNCKP